MTTLTSLLAAHLDGSAAIPQTIAACYARHRAHGDAAIFITLRPEAEVLAEAEALQAEGPRGRALWGIPVAVKDNIDVAGLPTTAACPAFAFTPAQDATVVARLRAAGAIVIGKTNLDQFATGLNGSRSPYGVPRNALRADLVPGGSSSGSASAVAAGIVPVALGTDTAGSGRVPAGLQNLVGLKPSLGLVSTAGVVPACRTLDCVSVFALTVEDAWAALSVAAGPDAGDPWSRALPLGRPGAVPPKLRIAVPRPEDLDVAGDAAAAASYAAAVERAKALGAEIVPLDMAPFYETARLLYEGPWVAERYLTIRDLLAKAPEAILPVIRQVIAGRPLPDAAETFAARYRVAELALVTKAAMKGIDALLVPTAPRPVTLAEMAADPVGANSLLGRYTNFVNLLDLCALAIPASLAADGTAAGVTLIAPAGHDAVLAAIGQALHAAAELPLGATGRPHPTLTPAPVRATPDAIEIAVVGAHLSGMPLNRELTDRGGTFLRATTTTADYRLFALPGGPPVRPGLIRVGTGGAAIALEVWSLPAEGFGRFVAGIPSPLGIGTLALADGTSVKGFLCETIATEGARDVTEFGGWRAFVVAQAKVG
ncbi:MAG TPA: allophanate hydrolase [Bosea sp. (in: a-proteobacteria)]|uniref:allophanate hydrolase n=1 Tax=Bosea sp. (in: a-proteobacteria) TaxID=1871050 RepID=UPI002DDCCC2C|nr:allophanate hydrolase [Bosea sp. (in: a-proteobacteria)]HEV2554892.1 allophanate hydrolase [Bosea sp. (in: a-proteobacteria)]